MEYKILLADDSVTVQKIITLTFKDEHVDVETVNNGDEAINKLQYLRPSLVMADVSIPGRDGYQICEYVKNHPDLRHIPVVLLVPAYEPFDAEKARRMGADTHLTKPFQSIKALITTVKNLIEPPPRIEAVVADEEIKDEPEPVQKPFEAEIDNVLDMTSRIAPARIQEEAEKPALDDFLMPVRDQASLVAVADVDYSIGEFPRHIIEEDRVLDIDDVLEDVWETPAAVVPESPIKVEPVMQSLAEIPSGISQDQIDEIVDRVVAQLMNSLPQKLTEKLVPTLTEEIISRISPEMIERDNEQPDDRQLSFHDPDTLLEIDEL